MSELPGHPPSSRSHFPAHRAKYATLLVLAVVVVLVMPISPSAGSWLERAAMNAAHAPVFAFAGFVCLWLYDDSSIRFRRLGLAALCLLAPLSEALQFFTGRSPSWSDLLNDLLGIAIGYGAWILFCRPRDDLPGTRRTALLAAILVATGLAVAPLAGSIMTAIAQQRGYPVLFDPTFSGALTMINILREDDGTEVAIDHGAVRVKLPPGPRAGIEIARFVPDWRGFGSLVIDLENPGAAELPLKIRVADREGTFVYRDRFKARLAIPGHTRRTFRYALADVESAPATRTTRLDDMSTIAIFRAAGAAAEFRLHSIRLE